MSNLSPSLLSLDEPVLEAATMPTPPPQPGEHNMHCRSQEIEPPCSLLNAHLRRHIHTHLGDGKFPNVATPEQTPDNMLLALAPTDGMAATHFPGGCTTPAPTDVTAATSPTGGCPTPDDDAEDNVNLWRQPACKQECRARMPRSPTVMESFAAAIDKLPDLEEPVHSYIW